MPGRVLIEESENLLFRAACPNGLKDPQPGAIFLRTRKAIDCLSLGAVPSWIADLAATFQLLRSGCIVRELEMDIREQSKTHMTLDRELFKIRQLEEYFGQSLLATLPDNVKFGKIRRCYEAYRHGRPSD